MKKDATTPKFNLNPDCLPKPDWNRFDAMTEAARHQAALADPDCPPATEEQLARAHRMPNIKAIRRGLNLTQEQFSRQFDLPLGSLRDWEQGSHRPDHAALAYLKVIAFNPQLVQQALHG